MEVRLKNLNLFILFIILQNLLNLIIAGADWASKCNHCKCVWSDGKKFANCTYLQLNAIPTDMSSDIRDFDFSFNPLYELRAYVFSNANLSDVHKLKLQNCSIEEIHNRAFENLLLLIELDLSNNNIKKLDTGVFKSAEKLRILSLWNNKLSSLEPELFSNLPHLHKIFLDNNELTAISSDLFSPGCPIIHVGLANNFLTAMDVRFLDNVPKLSSLDLSGNSWNCDCNLQQFRLRALESNLVTITPECRNPKRLRDRKWSDMNNIFACEPKILDPTELAKDVQVDGFSNYTLHCRIEGDPPPTVTWLHNNRQIDFKRNPNKFQITTSDFPPFWHNLTIYSVNNRDKGDYKCTATNDGGSTTKTIILDIYEYPGGITSASPQSLQFTWMIIVICLLLVTFLSIILLLCCCWRKRKQQQKLSKTNLSRSSEMMNFDGRSTDDKALITSANPVSKPPRQYWVASSVTSGGTEISEAKKMLVDEESCIGDDESHSIFDYTNDHSTLSNHHQRRPIGLIAAHPQHTPIYDHLDASLHYPPDLLAVPTMHGHRAVGQVSPAASYASSNTAPHSAYDTVSLMRYGTLPYSRSHSPFGGVLGLGVPVRVPRHGYVTIPRKPRSSWSSEPPGGLPEISEPLYDNLGLRTTATGSSVLSLNKDPATPRSTRNHHHGNGNNGLLSTGSPHSVPSSVIIEPIVEHDSSMSPVPISTVHNTLPRR